MTENKDKSFLHRKRKNDPYQYTKNDFYMERKIAIFRKSSILVLYVKKIYDLFYIIERLNMPYYYYSGEKLYFNYDKDINFFWSKKENKIIYESDINYSISYDTFFAFHQKFKPSDLKYFSDFCFFYLFFSDNEKETFVNNLDADVIDQLKDTRYLDDFKIVKFFGPQKNGKSTIVYYYFGMRRYIPLNEMFYIEDINNTEEFDEKDPKYYKESINDTSNNQIDICEELSKEIPNELNSNNEENEEQKNNKYFIRIDYNNSFKRKEGLNANSQIPLLSNENLEELNVFSMTNKMDNKFNEDNLKEYNNKIFEKEFYFTINDTIGFFRSCYLNHKFLQSKYSEDIKMDSLQMEFSGLFKSYKVYKFFINKFNDFYNESKSIIDIAEFIINFMEKYKKQNIRYFIVLDSITKDLIEQLKKLENIVRNTSNCFLVEIYENEGINEKYDNEVINGYNREDELIIYCENFCEYNGNYFDLTEEEQNFLSNNFNKNIYYYKKFINWKNINKGKDKEIFLNDISKDIQNELLKGFICEEEGKVFYRYIYKNVLNKKIQEKNIIKKLNLNYFFITKIKEKLKLKTLPFVENILKNLSATPLKDIVYQDYFIKFDEYVKGIMFEDIIKKEIREIFYNNVKDKKDFQELEIKRLVDNEIYTFYDKNTIEKILGSKKSFISLKSKLKLQKFSFKNKVTILYCVQNARHYDLGILFYDSLFIFQITINNKSISIRELLEFLEIDIYYILFKLELLTDEENLINNIYIYLVNVDFESIFSNYNDNKEIESYIMKNKEKNDRMKKKLKDKDIQIIYSAKNCELFDSNNKKIVCFPTKKYKNLYKNPMAKSLEYLFENEKKKNNILEILRGSKNLPNFIIKENITYHSLFYPGINLPENVILYFEYSSLGISFFKIKNKCYDMDLKESFNQYDMDGKIFYRKTIMIFRY